MFNFNIRAAIQSLIDSANSTPNTSTPEMANPNKGIPNSNVKPAAATPQQTDGMLSSSKAQNNLLEAKQDKKPLTYSNPEVELSATAIPEKEAPRVKEKKGFKANLMDTVSEQFKGQSSLDSANNTKNNSGPDTTLKEDNYKRPTPPTLHNPPSMATPNPTVKANLPPNPTWSQPSIPKSNMPKVNIPNVRRPG